MVKYYNIAPELAASDNFKYALTTSSSSCVSGLKDGGSFKDKISENKVPLLTDEEFIIPESKTFYLYIWLDQEETNTNTMNKSFDFSLDGSCTDTEQKLTRNWAYFGSTTQYFKNTAYKDNITSISIANNIDVPEGATSWNIGVSPSNASDVVAWLEDDNSGNGTFDLKICANGTIFANNSMQYAFYNMRKTSSINLDGLNTSNVNNMSQMFFTTGRNATNFSLDLGNQFNTSNVTNMSNMFSTTGRSAQTNFTLDLSAGSFNTSANTTRMFDSFPTSYGTIYVKDNDARNFLLNINGSINVQIK